MAFSSAPASPPKRSGNSVPVERSAGHTLRSAGPPGKAAAQIVPQPNIMAGRGRPGHVRRKEKLVWDFGGNLCNNLMQERCQKVALDYLVEITWLFLLSPGGGCPGGSIFYTNLPPTLRFYRPQSPPPWLSARFKKLSRNPEGQKIFTVPPTRAGRFGAPWEDSAS